MSTPSEGSPPRTALEDHDRDRGEASHPQLLLESPSMVAILSSVRAAVREEVRVAIAAQVTGAPGLLLSHPNTGQGHLVRAGLE